MKKTARTVQLAWAEQEVAGRAKFAGRNSSEKMLDGC
jgi:hypothetical protein